MEAEPYLVEIWLTPEGAMVGLVLFASGGFGTAPVEILTRDPGSGSRKETEEKLRRQLQSQALIYQAFYKLFSRKVSLPKERRRALPAFVKTLYEPAEPNRLLLLARLRYAKDLVLLIETFRPRRFGSGAIGRKDRRRGERSPADSVGAREEGRRAHSNHGQEPRSSWSSAGW